MNVEEFMASEVVDLVVGPEPSAAADMMAKGFLVEYYEWRIAGVVEVFESFDLF